MDASVQSEKVAKIFQRDEKAKKKSAESPESASFECSKSDYAMRGVDQRAIPQTRSLDQATMQITKIDRLRQIYEG